MRSSGMFSFERIRCRTVTPSVHGGGSVRIRVSRELLDPAGKDIAGLLHINGTKVFIPQGRQITIGSAKGCNIRIVDRMIEDQHLLITPKEKGFEITNLSMERRLAVKLEGIKDIAKLALGEENDLEIMESARVFLELSGIGANSQKRLLEMRLEVPQQDVTKAVSNLLGPKPEIEVVSIDQAMKGDKTQDLPRELIPVNSELLIKTAFSNATCLEDILDIFEMQKDELAKEDKALAIAGTASGGVSIGSIITWGIVGATAPISGFFLLLFGAGFVGLCTFGGFKIFMTEKNQNKLKDKFIEIMIKMRSEDIAKSLIGRDQKIVSEVLILLGNKNKRIAKEVRLQLQALGAHTDQPPQLEPPRA